MIKANVQSEIHKSDELYDYDLLAKKLWDTFAGFLKQFEE